MESKGSGNDKVAGAHKRESGWMWSRRHDGGMRVKRGQKMENEQAAEGIKLPL